MIAAIVGPAGVRSIVMIRACLVSGRIAVFEDEGANRMRVLDLLVDREVERTAAFGLDLGWSWDPLRFVRRHPPHHLSPAEQTTRQGVILWGASAAPQQAQQRSDQGRKPVISAQIVAGGPKSCLPYRRFESQSLRQKIKLTH